MPKHGSPPSPPAVTFWGAARTVTGSMHQLAAGGKTVLLDCGLFQGHRAESFRRNREFPFRPKKIDAVVLSHRLGIRKPDPRIYQEAPERVALPPERCVFVDDLGGNLKPAKLLGITTIKHERAETTISELERVLRPRPS